MAVQEQDLRLEILNTLLTTPHRNLEKLWPLHAELAKKDPRFYVRLAAWYADHGDVRDHQEMFIITLVLSDFTGHRDTGLALLRQMPPYQVVRVIDFINGRKEKVRVKVEDPSKPPVALPKKVQRKRKLPAQVPAFTWEELTADVGLFRNPPRSLRTEVTRYLREREADPDWFDSTALVARKALKRLYALLHVKPSERAQQILFDEQPPEGSRLAALKELTRAAEPAAQAAAITRHRIPFRIAASVVAKMTPEVLRALVEVMSAQELVNNLAMLKRRGAFDDPALRDRIDQRLEEAKSSQRVAALKTSVAAQVADVAPEVAAKLSDVAGAQLKARGRITRPTALLIDKSGSMEIALEIGKRIGAMISTICEGGLFVYAFDSIAYPIEPAGSELADWEKALHGITAGGGTSCGVAVEWMRKRGQKVEQIVLVTDEEENSHPFFSDTLKKYRQDLGVDPNVCIVRTPNGRNHLETKCRQEGIPVDVFPFQGDYYSLPNLVPMLARPSKLELMMEILGYPLPPRKP